MTPTSALRRLAGAAVALSILSSTAVTVAGASAPAALRSGASATTTAACTAGSSACPIRITFAPGAYSGQAHSQLSGMTSVKWFVVHARRGQVMVVVVEGAGPTRGTVYGPNGTSNGQPGGRVFDGVLSATGDYRIRVSESPMGSAWSGRVDVVALIY